jgi:UDP-glucose 4-epimerase
MRILVTGGSGFIGSHLVEHYQHRAEVRVLDSFRTGHRRNLEGLQCELIEGSVVDESKLADAVQGVDIVYHLAALVSVPESMARPREAVDINAHGTLAVLEASAQAGVRKLVLASSAAIYGDNPAVPKLESMLPEPKSPYAVTKLDGEYYLAMYAREGRLPTAALRFFNVFGPRQDPKSPYAAAVPIFMEKALRHEDITIFGDGEQTRDFVFVKDIVSGLVFAAENEHVSGTYNCGYGGSMTVNELARRVIGLAGSKSRICYAPVRAGDVKHSRASVDKLLAAGWKPVSNLDEGLGITLAAYRSAASFPEAHGGPASEFAGRRQ